LNDLLTRHTCVQRDANVTLVSKDINLCFVCLNVSLTRSSQVQRDAEEYLVSIGTNLCFVCLKIGIQDLPKSRDTSHKGFKHLLSIEEDVFLHRSSLPFVSEAHGGLLARSSCYHWILGNQFSILVSNCIIC